MSTLQFPDWLPLLVGLAGVAALAVALDLVLGGLRWVVVLEQAGHNKIAVIKAIRTLTGNSLLESKQLSERLGQAILVTQEKAQALEAQAELEKAGAVVSLRRLRAPDTEGLAQLSERSGLLPAGRGVWGWVRLGAHQRGLLSTSAGELLAVLRPGLHLLAGRRRLQVVSTRERELQVPDLKLALAADARLREELLVLDLDDEQRALLSVDGRLERVLGPGQYAFWRVLRKVEPTVVSLREDGLRLPHRRLASVLAAAGAVHNLLEVSVAPAQRALVYKDERLLEELGPGRYAYWRGGGKLEVKLVGVEQPQEVTAHLPSAITKDKVVLQALTCQLQVRVKDARRALEKSRDFQAELRELAVVALREAVAKRSLDELLASQREVAGEVSQALAGRATALGVTAVAEGVAASLDGETRALMSGVLAAQLKAEAERVARREEVAATRSRLNTARLIERSPALRRLKELEAVERLAGQVESLTVVGGLGDLAERLLPRLRS